MQSANELMSETPAPWGLTHQPSPLGEETLPTNQKVVINNILQIIHEQRPEVNLIVVLSAH